MAGLVRAVQEMVGQPSSVRVGVVDSLSPLQISAQGVPFEDVGVLAGAMLQVGNPVVLLGQCSEAGSDPASWLALGSPTPGGMRVQSVNATANVTLPGANVDITGTTFDFTTTLPQTLITAAIYADLDVLAANIATAVVRPSLDGALLGSETQVIVESPVAAVAGRWTVGARMATLVGPGDHQLKLVGSTAVGVANTFRAMLATTGYLLTIYG